MAEFLIQIINVVFGLLWWAILIKVLLSWLPMAGIRIDLDNPFIRVLSSITDPILDPLRKYTTIGMMDLSPIVALIGIRFLQNILITLIAG